MCFILLLFAAYVVFKLRRGGVLRGKKSLYAVWLILACTLPGQFFYRLHPVNSEDYLYQSYFWGGGTLLGLLATFLIYSLALDAGSFLYLGVQKVFWRGGQTDVQRRDYLGRVRTQIVLALSTVSSLAGLAVIRKGPQIKEVTIPISTLPSGFPGIKIVQISDLHVGALITRTEVEFVVDEVLKQKPDVIVVTGDLADGTVELLRNSLAPLSRLKAPLGTFYVTGNHEYYWGAELWLKFARDIGWTPLLNENRTIEIAGVPLLMAGVTDTSGENFFASHRSDPVAAAIHSGKVAAKILLAHRPSSCFGASQAGFDLQLSGHTHGGQFFPWSLFVPLANPYVRGLNLHEKMWVYVNQGTGYWGPPNRLGYPSEITVVTLVSGVIAEA